MKLDRRESEIKRAVQRYLEYSGLFWLRTNSGVIPMERNGRKRIVRLCRPGTADFEVLITRGCARCNQCHLVLWVECKRGIERLSPRQEKFRDEVQRRGHEFIIVRDIETLDRKIKEFL